MTAEPKTYPLRGENRSFLTASLFYEPWSETMAHLRAEGSEPVFSLIGKPGYVDARQTFLDERDPTGVKWADKWLEGINHLNKLLQSGWFAEKYEIWQGELESILTSEALEKIRGIASGSSPAAFQANKFIASKEYKKISGRGRPSKAEVSGALKKELQKNAEHQDDLSRITAGRPNLKVV